MDSLRPVKACLLLTIAAFCFVLTATATATGAGEDPCAGPEAAHLLCPNLRIGPPSDLYVEHGGGRTLLRATSDVRSRGTGPMELRGNRNGPRSMRVHQRIYRAGGGHIDVPTKASLHFTDVGAYFGGSYWKVHQLAHFELWSVDGHHRLLHRVRSGPKLNYCLRDLERTRPGKRSPSHFHYPGCNQDPYQDSITLGTSVGWSDIYPADYS
jgi:predicted small secreted protein